MSSLAPAIATLKEQFERAIADPRNAARKTEAVRVEQPGEGRWLFWLRTRKTVSFRPASPRSIWIDSARISTKVPDLSFVAAGPEGKNMLVLVEFKRAAPTSPSIQEWRLASVTSAAPDLLKDPVRNVAATRSVRALLHLFRNADVHAVEEAASQSRDLGVVARALEQPDAIEVLEEDDPFAAARLRGVRERERLLSEEGGTWSVEQVAKHLNLTRQAVNRRRKQGMLLALDAGRHGFRYPAWQFSRKGTLEGLEQVLVALSHVDPWMQQAFMLGKSARLRNRRPIDVLRSGDVTVVTNAASAFGEHGGP